MKKKIYSLFDKKIQAYQTPMVVDHEGQIVRSLQDAVNGREVNDLTQHAADFDLYKLAEMDMESGIIEPATPQPVFIVNAGTLQGAKNERNAET